MPNILAFAGSARKESVNKKLIHAAAARAAAIGADVTVIDLRDYPTPLYDGDLEESEGIPDNAARMYEMLKSHDGLLLSCPEYNSSITPLLKNTIDWASRPRQGEPPLVAFKGKAAGLLAASPGALGGLRGLVTVRSILGNIGVFVCPAQMALSKAHEAFNDDGSLKDERMAGMLDNTVRELWETTQKLAT